MYDHKIIVKNSHIEIHEYNMGDCRALEGSFALYDIISHSYYYLGLHYDEENKILYVPRGIDIWRLEKWFGCDAYVDHYYDDCRRMDDITIKSLPRDERQKETLRFMLGQDEYSNNKYKSQLCVNLNTGVGKTYVSTFTMAYESVASMVITYSKSLLKQWADKIIEYTNIAKKDIYMISGSNTIHMILNGKHNPKKIYLATHSTIKSYGDQYGWDKIGELFKLLGIGIKIFDEAHQNFANTIMIDFFTNTWKTYYVTATLMRSDKNENIIYNLYTKNIPKIELFDKESDPHTKYLALLYNSKATGYEISNCKNQYGLNRVKYVNLMRKKERFWQMFDITFDFITKLGGKSLICIATNDAICDVYDYIMENYPNYKNQIGVYTSLVNKDKEDQLRKPIILTTTKSAGTGMDIKGLKSITILLEPFKSPVLARQTLGRCRDSNTWYIELVDLAFPQTRKYYYEKLPVFEKYALSVQHIQFNDADIESKSMEVRDQLRSYTRNKNVVYMIDPISFAGEPIKQNIIPFTFNHYGNINPITFKK